MDIDVASTGGAVSERLRTAARALEAKDVAREVPARFWTQVRRLVPRNGQSTLCWTWQGYINRAGLGVFRLNGRIELAHRVSFVLARGDVPPDCVVIRRCGQKKCVRPDHLMLQKQRLRNPGENRSMKQIDPAAELSTLTIGLRATESG